MKDDIACACGGVWTPSDYDFVKRFALHHKAGCRSPADFATRNAVQAKSLDVYRREYLGQWMDSPPKPRR